MYWNGVYPYLSAYSQSQAKYLMINHDYGVPIGGSANYADYILALGLFICVGQLFSGSIDNSKHRLWAYFLCICFVLGMVIQNRRSELLATILSIALMCSFTLKPGLIKRSKFLRIMGIFCVLIVGIYLLYSRGMLDRIVETFRDLSLKSSKGLEKAGNGRVALWKQAFLWFFERPIFGISLEQIIKSNTWKV